jgi:hypothetical protein
VYHRSLIVQAGLATGIHPNGIVSLFQHFPCLLQAHARLVRVDLDDPRAVATLLTFSRKAWGVVLVNHVAITACCADRTLNQAVSKKRERPRNVDLQGAGGAHCTQSPGLAPSYHSGTGVTGTTIAGSAQDFRIIWTCDLPSCSLWTCAEAACEPKTKTVAQTSKNKRKTRLTNDIGLKQSEALSRAAQE